MKPDYNEYAFTGKEWVCYIGQGIFLCVVVNFLFYQNLVVFLFMFPIPILWLKWKKRLCIKQRKKVLNYQFKDALNSLAVSLRAGYSVESGLLEAEKEMRNWNDQRSEIVQELSYINGKIKLNVPVEELLSDFAIRSDVEDIQNFASVFSIARRMGGDMAGVVLSTVRVISEKIDVEREIETAVAAKKFEQTIMSLMPLAFIGYMQLASPGFLDVLYHGLPGILFMTVCLGIYVIAWWWGRRIVEIEV